LKGTLTGIYTAQHVLIADKNGGSTHTTYDNDGNRTPYPLFLDEDGYIQPFKPDGRQFATFYYGTNYGFSDHNELIFP